MSTDALIFTARFCCSSESVFSFASDTSTTAAAPSPVGQHISSVFGYEITRASMISSSVNTFWYCASGFSVECAWFFSRDLGELLEADAVVLVGVLHAGLPEHRRHRARAEPAVDRHDPAVATLGLVTCWRPLRAALPAEQAHLAHLLHADREADVGFAGLDRRGSTVRTAVAPVAHALTHVVDRDAGLADLLLRPAGRCRPC